MDLDKKEMDSTATLTECDRGWTQSNSTGWVGAFNSTEDLIDDLVNDLFDMSVLLQRITKATP